MEFFHFSILLAYAVLGALVGVTAGLLGVGGGLIIVPALIWLFTYQGFDYSVIAHAAIGTSLVTIIVTSLSSAWAHHARRAVLWSLVKQLSLGLMIGAFFGAWLADQLNTLWLQRVFGLFAILVSLRIFFKAKVEPSGQLPGLAGMNGTGLSIGLVSGLVGIGGGSMTVPFLTWGRVDIRKAVATSAACGLPIALAGAAGFAFTGANAAMPDYSSGFLYWPAAVLIGLLSVLFAPLGAKLAHSMPVLRLKQVFAVLLMLIGWKLILS